MPYQYLQTISTLYLVQKKIQFEAISLLVHTFPRVAQAMWWVAQAMWSGLRRLCGGLIENKAKLSPAKLGLRLSLAIKEGSKCLLNIYKLFPLYPHFQNVQFEAISLLVHTFSQVAQAMWSRLRRLCGQVAQAMWAGCAGYVVD